jgi:NAD(P)-dependent dehydrogenase (short-subunit alcohol dehydrogenase family)
MKSSSYSGKVAAITGAASGIGRSLAVALAQRGCALAIVDVDEKGLAETAALASAVKVTTRRLDVSSSDALRDWAGEVQRDHSKVNLLFNNAGISYGATVRDGDEAEFRRVIDVDFWGVVHGTRAFLPLLEASGDGHVVNISSIFGIVAFPGQSAYNAAKFAVRGFTEALRIELEITGSPVSATCVHPGGVKTNIAKTTRLHASVASLGGDPNDAGAGIDKMLTLSPDKAAEIILRAVQKNARRVLVGSDARMLDLLQRWSPGGYHGVLVREALRRKKARLP